MLEIPVKVFMRSDHDEEQFVFNDNEVQFKLLTIKQFLSNGRVRGAQD